MDRREILQIVGAGAAEQYPGLAIYKAVDSLLVRRGWFVDEEKYVLTELGLELYEDNKP